MTKLTRHRQGMQAAINAVWITTFSSIYLLWAAKEPTYFIPIIPTASFVIFVTTYTWWRIAFEDDNAWLWRAIWVGAAIVIVSMFLMWALLIVQLIITGDLPAGDFKTDLLKRILHGPLLTIPREPYGNYIPQDPRLTIPTSVLIPIGMLFTIFIRSSQVRFNNYESKVNNDESEIFSKRFHRNFKRVVISIIIAGTIGSITLFHLIFSWSVVFVSHSPSGKKIFRVYEQCFLDCSYLGKIILKKGFFKTEHKYCNMDLRLSIRPLFQSNSTIKWHSDESVITWETSRAGPQTIKLSDCRKNNCDIFIGCH
jgi:hypothetical protein